MQMICSWMHWIWLNVWFAEWNERFKMIENVKANRSLNERSDECQAWLWKCESNSIVEWIVERVTNLTLKMWKQIVRWVNDQTSDKLDIENVRTNRSLSERSSECQTWLWKCESKSLVEWLVKRMIALTRKHEISLVDLDKQNSKSREKNEIMTMRIQDIATRMLRVNHCAQKKTKKVMLKSEMQWLYYVYIVYRYSQLSEIFVWVNVRENKVLMFEISKSFIMTRANSDPLPYIIIQRI